LSFGITKELVEEVLYRKEIKAKNEKEKIYLGDTK
jgi:hypothetical protein